SVYIVQSRLQGLHTVASVCCFHADTGLLLWEQEVLDAPEFAADQPARCRHHLLTQAGPYLVYVSHAGACVAIDAASGKRVWAVCYPGRGAKTADGGASPRDLCPARAAN